MVETTQPQVDDAANQPDSAAAENAAEAVREPSESEPFLTVRYNKEDKSLSREDAVTYAQKGMNYDKLSGRLEEAKAKLNEYEQDGVVQLAKAFAERSGMSMEAALEQIRSQLEKGLDKDAAKRTAADVQLADFAARNPGVDVRSLPKPVLDAWRSGVPLGEAVAGYKAQRRIAALEKQIAQMQTNVDNAAASMGAPKSSGSASPKVLNAQTIANMSKAELERNHERIWAYLTGVKRGE